MAQACTVVDSFRSPGVPSPAFHSVTTSGDMKHWWPDCSSVAQNTWRVRRVHLGQPPTAEQVVVERLLEHRAAVTWRSTRSSARSAVPIERADHDDPRGIASGVTGESPGERAGCRDHHHRHERGDVT